MSRIERHYDEHGTLPPCEPWCSNHQHDAKYPPDGWCRTLPATFGEFTVYLTNTGPDDQPRVNIEGGLNDAASVEDARALAKYVEELTQRATPACSDTLDMIAQIAEIAGYRLDRDALVGCTMADVRGMTTAIGQHIARA